MKNAEGWDSQRLEALAKDIYNWLIEHEMWIDVAIYYDGKRMHTIGKEGDKTVFRYNGEPFIDEADPRTYFEYVAYPHILSMSFEGPLYDLLNYGFDDLENEFEEVFKKHGVYYELGNAWNLTCYED